MTPADLINLALIDSGVLGQGQTASGEDTNNAFTRLNMMISQWARKRYLLYDLVNVTKVSTGALSYTIGPGMDFNTPRPDRLENGCFFRQLNAQNGLQVDYPLGLIQSQEDYNLIALKSMGTWPAVVFYDSAYPTGTIYVWPVPASGLYEIHLLVKVPLAQFTSLTQDINLPPEYQAAIHYNLCTRLRPAYQLAPDPSVTALAVDSLNVLRNANAQIQSLKMPWPVVRRRFGYNVYSDI